MQITDFLRDSDTGLPVATGTSVEIYRVSDDTLLDTVTTASDGSFTYTSDANPGAVYYTATVGGTTKIHSTKSTMPVGVNDLSSLRYALSAWNPGVIYQYPNNNTGGGLKVTANGSDMVVTVATGAAIGYGVIHNQSAAATITVDPSPASGSRTDTIVVRLYYSGANAGKTELIYDADNAGYEPDATQTVGHRDVHLATITVDAGVVAIATNKVTDRRVYASPQIGNGYVTTAMIADDAITPAKQADTFLAGTIRTISQAIATTAATVVISNGFQNLIEANTVLAAGQWTGQVYFSVEATSADDPFTSLTPTMRGQFGATLVTVKNSVAVSGVYAHYFGHIDVVAATGTQLTKLEVDMGASSRSLTIRNGRIYGTLIKTG